MKAEKQRCLALRYNSRFSFSQSLLKKLRATKLIIENLICDNWVLSGRSLRFENSGRMTEKATLHFSSKFQSTVVYFLYNLLNSHAKQSEKENVAPVMLFDYTV